MGDTGERERLPLAARLAVVWMFVTATGSLFTLVFSFFLPSIIELSLSGWFLHAWYITLCAVALVGIKKRTPWGWGGSILMLGLITTNGFYKIVHIVQVLLSDGELCPVLPLFLIEAPISAAILVAMFRQKSISAFLPKEIPGSTDQKDSKRPAMKKIETEEHNVEEKIAEVDYAAGSGSIFGQEMKQIEIGILKIDGHRYHVGKEVFQRASVGDRVKIHRKQSSGDLVKMEIFWDGAWAEF